MKTQTKGKVVMLTTDGSSRLYILMGRLCRSSISYGQEIFPNAQNMHLYITSDNEIKAGDWCYHLGFQRIEKWTKNSSKDSDKSLRKKIIATTDPYLNCKQLESCYKSLTGKCICSDKIPQPSESFIKAYIEAYNSGNKINDVMIDGEDIRPAKQTFSRQEV